jgi:TonB family protein
VIGPAIEIRGWVLDSSDSEPSIKPSVDQQPIEAALQRVARKDVCTANPAVEHCATSKPGFVLTLATARLLDGSHTIRLNVANKDGSSAVIATQEFSVKKKTCLVLSVGAERGLAHIGAIDALKESGIKPDCVAGNSMGAVIGGLYVTAPDAELKPRFQKLMGKYKEMTLEAARGRAALGALVGGLLTGGLGAAAMGGAAGAATVERIDRVRFTKALAVVFENASIESLPVPFATSYQTIEGTGMGPYITARTGSLTRAVSCSANNVALFKQEITKAECLDPGTDRPARVPVDEACKTFQPARIIAINVTGESSFVSPQMNCDVKEIMIPASSITNKAMEGDGPDFENAYMVGYKTTMDWISKNGLVERNDATTRVAAYRPTQGSAQPRSEQTGAIASTNNRGDVFRVGRGVTPPAVISRVEPEYSDLARKRRIEGTVVLEAIVKRDGSVDILRVVRGLGFGLDENAVQALKQWRFRPGMNNGKPVDVSLNIEVNFNFRQ